MAYVLTEMMANKKVLEEYRSIFIETLYKKVETFVDEKERLNDSVELEFQKEALANELSKKFIVSDLGKEEQLPEFDFKNEVQKIAWLYELGVLELILSETKEDDTFVWRRAANIIHSFTGINPETIRKCLMALFQKSVVISKNNPLNNPDNKLFVSEMKNKFKIKREKK